MLIIGQLSDKQILESHFEISFGEKQECFKKYFVDGESEINVVTCQQKHNFSVMHYGMSPFWSGQKNLYFEAPVEGEINEYDEPANLKRRIILHPAFRKPIRENRCLIPTNYFIIPSEFGEVYLFYYTESKPFALAGIYDSWKNSIRDGLDYRGFAVLTTPANDMLRKIGISRMPLILPARSYTTWLDREAPLVEITALMNITSGKYVNGYPIHRNSYLNKTDNPEIYRSSGELIHPENQDVGKIASVLKSFRYKNVHAQRNELPGERLWRNSE